MRGTEIFEIFTCFPLPQNSKITLILETLLQIISVGLVMHRRKKRSWV